jgi:FAD binding domain
VVIPADASDVAAAVRCAADAGLGIGVQSTGSGPVCQVDGMLIVTSRMDGVTVDPAARTATVEAGCTSGQVLAAAQEHGLAPLIGSVPSIGAVGFTLGGGVGWLSRKYGPACDAVRWFDVVTPDGCLVHASAAENRDLFAGLRGGGGGALGVVTSMEIDLFPVTTVYAGNLLYPASAAVQVTEYYARWVTGAPDDLTSSVLFMNFPPSPDVPEAIRGQSFLMVRGCWSGDLAEGRRFVDRLRADMPPMMDAWQEMPFAESASISSDPAGPAPVVDAGGWLTGLDGEVAAIAAAGTFPAAGPPPVIFTEIRHLGGAISRNASCDSVMGNRDQQFLYHAVAITTEHSGQLAATAGQARLAAALSDHRSAGTHHNFLDGDGRRRSTRTSTDPVQHDRLASLQGRLDPHDLMRYGVTHVG